MAFRGREVTCPASHSWEQGYNLQGLAASTAAQEGKAADGKRPRGERRKMIEEVCTPRLKASLCLPLCTCPEEKRGCRQQWRPDGGVPHQ